MKILSVSCVYPNELNPQAGVFVQSRLQHLAALADVRVMAPVPLIDYAQRRLSRGVKSGISASGGPLANHPRWLYPPSGGVLNDAFLCAQLVRPIARLRQEFDFDLLDAHFGHPTGVATALLACHFHRPFFVTLRGDETMHAEYAARRSAMAWTLKRAARVITVSERLRQFAISLGVNPEMARTIPNGVDAAVFFARNRVEMRQRYGIPLDMKVILSAGYLIERKGHHRIIVALQALHELGIPACLLIAGGAGREGNFEKQIHSTVHELGLGRAVRFLGPLPPISLAEVMSAADVFCLASTREGWPNVVHEAQACGLPVVSTDVGAVQDMVPSERYGFVVPVNCRQRLAEALGRALQSQWDRELISRWAHSRSWEQVAREVFEEMNQVLSECKSPKGMRV